MSNDWEISILGLTDDQDDDQASYDDGARGWVRRAAETELTRSTVTSGKLRDNLDGFLRGIQSVVGAIPEHVGAFRLTEITLSAEISASGKVSLMGSGAEMTGTGGIAFKLSRRSDGHYDGNDADDDE